MSEQEILEGNTLIAEYMGIQTKFYSDVPHIRRWNYKNLMLYDADLKYHSLWNWLMPVIEKIGKEDTVKEVVVSTLKTRVWTKESFIEVVYDGDMISKCFTTVVKFIKCYNQNK